MPSAKSPPNSDSSVDTVNKAINILNTATPEQIQQGSDKLNKVLATVSAIVDPNGDKHLSSSELLAMLNDKDTVKKILLAAGPKREDVAELINMAREKLGDFCTYLTPPDKAAVNQTIERMETSLNTGIQTAKAASESGTAGNFISTAVGQLFPDAPKLNENATNALNTLVSDISHNVANSVAIPRLSEACPAVEGASPVPAAMEEISREHPVSPAPVPPQPASGQKTGSQINKGTGRNG